jgi:hypothetical protein
LSSSAPNSASLCPTSPSPSRRPSTAMNYLALRVHPLLGGAVAMGLPPPGSPPKAAHAASSNSASSKSPNSPPTSVIPS